MTVIRWPALPCSVVWEPFGAQLVLLFCGRDLEKLANLITGTLMSIVY